METRRVTKARYETGSQVGTKRRTYEEKNRKKNKRRRTRRKLSDEKGKKVKKKNLHRGEKKQKNWEEHVNRLNGIYFGP